MKKEKNCDFLYNKGEYDYQRPLPCERLTSLPKVGNGSGAIAPPPFPTFCRGISMKCETIHFRACFHRENIHFEEKNQENSKFDQIFGMTYTRKME